MAILGEIIYNIKDMIGGGIASDDQKPTEDHILYMLNYYRAKLIRQKYDRISTNIEGLSQVLGKDGKVNTEKLNSKNDIQLSGFARRTETKIPKPISLTVGLAIGYVGSVDGRIEYQRETRLSANYSKYIHFGGQFGKWYELDGYIYIKTPKSVSSSAIGILGIFENPVEVMEFNGIDVDDVEYNVEYPIHSDMLDTIFKMLLSSEIQTKFTLPKDDKNDSRDVKVNAEN